MEYKSLRELFYADPTNERFERYPALAEQRRSADSSFRTGILTDSGELFLAVPRELSMLNEAVLRQERTVSELSSTLPPIAYGALVRDLVISEVVSTNELEGVHSTRKQIHDAIEMQRETLEATRQKRFGELAKLYLDLTEQPAAAPKGPQDVRDIYDRVMRGEELGDDAPDGTIFRRKEVAVYNQSGIAVHDGLFPETAIIDAIDLMLRLVNSPEVPQTYGAIMGHYIFEHIHPFYDGNGRTGRYLLARWLSEPLSILTSLSLSRAIFDNKDSYYRAFKSAQHPLMHGELTFFVMTILGFVREAQDGLASRLLASREKLGEVDEALRQLQGRLELASQEVSILNMLSQVTLFSTLSETRLADIAAYLGCGTATARKYTKALEKRGLLETVSRSPLVFVLSEHSRSLLGLGDKITEA